MTGGMLKLYQLIPIESDLAKALTSGEVGEALGMTGSNLGEAKGFGEFDGVEQRGEHEFERYQPEQHQRGEYRV